MQTWYRTTQPLLRLFQCHINVELAHSTSLIICLYKYFYKGPDYTKGQIEDDEIKQYIQGRYLSAAEAVHRFFEYELTRRDPSEKPYPVHLPGHKFSHSIAISDRFANKFCPKP